MDEELYDGVKNIYLTPGGPTITFRISWEDDRDTFLERYEEKTGYSIEASQNNFAEGFEGRLDFDEISSRARIYMDNESEERLRAKEREFRDVGGLELIRYALEPGYDETDLAVENAEN